MSNILENGAVLPSGLLGSDSEYEITGFNKTYKNYPLRMGIIISCYPKDDPNNISGLTNEYDVLVFEQQEDSGTTVITYKNCLSSDGLGSIADYFEKTLRVKKASTNNTNLVDTKNQNGAVVLLLCLDAVSEKGIILGAINHPDRKTTLVDEGPRLEGEFNGMNLKIEKDGSSKITFRGATDNDGKTIDSTQGNTEFDVEKDGSFQIKHDKITQRLDRNGQATLTAKDNISNNTEKDFNVSAKENIRLKSEKDSFWDTNKFLMKATGSAIINCQSMNINSQSAITMSGGSLSVDAASMAMIKASSITLDGQVSLGGKGGQPILLLGTVMYGIGNLSAPVISTPIFGFANKVTGQ